MFRLALLQVVSISQRLHQFINPFPNPFPRRKLVSPVDDGDKANHISETPCTKRNQCTPYSILERSALFGLDIDGRFGQRIQLISWSMQWKFINFTNSSCSWSALRRSERFASRLVTKSSSISVDSTEERDGHTFSPVSSVH